MDPDPDFLPIRNRTQEKKSDPEPDKMTGSETLSKRNINLTGQCHEINQAFGVKNVKNVKNVTTDNNAYTSETLQWLLLSIQHIQYSKFLNVFINQLKNLIRPYVYLHINFYVHEPTQIF